MDRNDTTPAREKDPAVVELSNNVFRDTVHVAVALATTEIEGEHQWFDAPVLNRNVQLDGDARDALAWLSSLGLVERDEEFFRWVGAE